MNTKQMVEKYGEFNILMNAVSMLVHDLEFKENLTDRERYLLEAWDKFIKAYLDDEEYALYLDGKVRRVLGRIVAEEAEKDYVGNHQDQQK